MMRDKRRCTGRLGINSWQRSLH